MVFRQRSDLPVDLAPDSVGYGNGQYLLADSEWLARLASQLGLTRLGDFVVDPHERLRCALDEEGWIDVEPARREAEIPHPDFNNGGVTVSRKDERGRWRHFAVSEQHTPESLASRRRHDEIEAEVEKTTPWFDPEDGLRTVRGLIEFLDRRGSPPGERGLGSDWSPGPIDRDEDWDGRDAIPDLRTLELHLEYVSRMQDRFHLCWND